MTHPARPSGALPMQPARVCVLPVRSRGNADGEHQSKGNAMAHTTEAITGTENILDSRDIDARIEHLEAEGADSGDSAPEEAEELAALLAFREEMQGYVPDWNYGATLIRDDYMQSYAQETAEDCGMIQRDAAWPACHIDWEAATAAFQQDYTSAELMGSTYWGR